MKNREKYYVVAYDVVDDRRRNELHRLLKTYGMAVQLSVFECRLAESRLRELERRALALIDRRTDTLRFFELCRECSPRSVTLGRMGTAVEPTVFVL